ncbi:MAG: beta-lactamase family protein [Roseibium sp.]|uniref:serine hydrolase domain-containing protein n=1 Tax=Roseibium sp. TaxID=1936156 RepID=UPI002609483F|nr:serine hydrolase domain-containing protein [Roseibium sp.]MCV0425649.1 beta-lactamase family protein [Roseibium sp.]
MNRQSSFDAAFARLEAAVTSGRVPGGVLGLVSQDGSRITRAVGHAQLEPDPRPMTEDTWFDLASVSKVVFTTERILAHARNGRIDLDAPLVALIPDLRQYHADTAWERQLTVRQCLGHQTGLPPVFPIYTYGRDPDQLRAFVLQHEWPRGPAAYSCINFILLGIGLERLEGCRIRDMEPGFGFAFSSHVNITAASEHCHWRGRVMVGEVHDENCFALQGAGNAGLFGNVSSVLDYAYQLLEMDGAGNSHTRLLRTEIGPTRGHGWELPHPDWSGSRYCSDQTIGHTGFTGTGLWVDFAAGHAWTLLTNRVHPSRFTPSDILQLRQAVAAALYGKD